MRFRGCDLSTAKFFSPILLGLFLAGCAAESSHVASNSTIPAASYVAVAQQPAQLQVESGAQDVDTSVARDAEKKRTGQNVSDQKLSQQRKATQRGVEESKSALRETDGQGKEISLFVRNDDGEEEDLTSLLTEDYLRQFDIPIVFNDAVQYFVRYFTTEKRKIMANWLKRSKRYVPMIKEILREQGLPEDLIYLAMIESGFNPKAYSSMKACGPWQFIYETGGRYGLRVDHWVDQRRDPEKSTVAAALYLKDLFNQFGNWYLAAAGYNAGEKRIERAVERHETSDFWELSKYNTLPRETREYIPRLLAAAIIAKEPERFGFVDINYDQPIRFVNEKVPGATPLAVLAKAASTDVATIRSLNPELLTGITPPDADDYSIKLPEWVKRERFREDLRAALEEGGKVEQITTYTCKRRDSLASVMRQHRVTYKDLLLVNSCDQTLVARQGSVIYIPKFSGQTDQEEESTPAVQEAAPVARKEPEPEVSTSSRVSRATPVKTAGLSSKTAADSRTANFHIVRKGEKLADISERYGIDMLTLREINNIKKNHIRPNMRLILTAVHAQKTDKPVRTAIYHTSKKKSLLSGTVVKYEKSSIAPKERNHSKKKSAFPRQTAKLKTKSGKTKRATRG